MIRLGIASAVSLQCSLRRRSPSGTAGQLQSTRGVGAFKSLNGEAYRVPEGFRGNPDREERRRKRPDQEGSDKSTAFSLHLGCDSWHVRWDLLSVSNRHRFPLRHSNGTHPQAHLGPRHRESSEAIEARALALDASRASAAEPRPPKPASAGTHEEGSPGSSARSIRSAWSVMTGVQTHRSPAGLLHAGIPDVAVAKFSAGHVPSR